MYKLCIFFILFSLFFSFPVSAHNLNRNTKIDVKVKVLKESSVNDSRIFSSVTLPYNEKTIITEISVKILKVYVLNGEWVEKGQKLLSFDKAVISGDIEETVKTIEGWNKIFSERRGWKERDRKAELEALKKIKSARVYLKKLKYFKSNPFITSPVSGRVSSVLSAGDHVSKNSVLVRIIDDYLIKIKLNKSEEHFFTNGEIVDVKIDNSNRVFSGRVKSDKKGMFLLINNSKLLISPGSTASFKTEKNYIKSIFLNREDFFTENGKNYVYIVKENLGIKKFVELEKISSGKYLAVSNLKDGDIIISPVLDSKLEKIEINIKRNSVEIPVNKFSKKKYIASKKQIYKGKKIEYVISAGISLSKPEEMHYRAAGLDSMISQYSQFYGLENNHSGSFKENYLGIPFSINVNYLLKNDMFLKGGVEFAFMRNRSSRLYKLNWKETTEKYDYTIQNGITNIMPFFGVEKRFSSFGLYVTVGLNLAKIKHTNELNYSEGTYSMNNISEYNINGTGLSFIFGGKYMIKIGKKNRLFLKAEYLFGRLSDFSGNKTVTESDSSGESYSANESGSLYTLEYNPYDISWFKWWELYQNIPEGSDIRNVSKFSLNFSRIRMMIGFSF